MTPSRERFELGLFEARLGEVNGYVKGVLHKLYGDVLDTYRPNDMLQIGHDGEKLNVTVIPRENLFYNTTSETGPKLAEYQAKVGEQNAEVLAIFQRLRRPLSPSQVLAHYPSPPGGLLPPLTSIRRACNTLTKAGALVKTDMKRKGLYNRNEHYWALPEDRQHG